MRSINDGARQMRCAACARLHAHVRDDLDCVPYVVEDEQVVAKQERCLWDAKSINLRTQRAGSARLPVAHGIITHVAHSAACEARRKLPAQHRRHNDLLLRQPGLHCGKRVAVIAATTISAAHNSVARIEPDYRIPCQALTSLNTLEQKRARACGSRRLQRQRRRQRRRGRAGARSVHVCTKLKKCTHWSLKISNEL